MPNSAAATASSSSSSSSSSPGGRKTSSSMAKQNQFPDKHQHQGQDQHQHQHQHQFLRQDRGTTRSKREGIRFRNSNGDGEDGGGEGEGVGEGEGEHGADGKKERSTSTTTNFFSKNDIIPSPFCEPLVPELTTHITVLHAVFFLIMVALVFAGSLLFPTIDLSTLKPGPSFPASLKEFSRLTNIPIKLGIFHGGFFLIEWWFERDMFQRHVGQRITTLWYQLFQHQRFGQHLHMQVETVLQLADALTLSSRGTYNDVFTILFLVMSGVMMFTCLITSSAYHTFEEQMIGLILAIVKLVFDYTDKFGFKTNLKVGESLTKAVNAVLGGLTLTIAVAFNNFSPLDPTVMATLIIVGALMAEGGFLLYAHRDRLVMPSTLR